MFFSAVITCLQFNFLKISSSLQLINEELDLQVICSLGPVCSHNTSILSCLHIFLSVVFHFSIILCIFVILISFTVILDFVKFHILGYNLSSVVLARIASA